MQPFGVIASRVLVPLLGLAVWSLVYLDARLAYRLPRGVKRFALQFSTVLGAAGTFVLQVELMNRFFSADAYGDYFFSFILIECGGGLVVLFSTLIRERSRSVKRTSGALSGTDQKH